MIQVGIFTGYYNYTIDETIAKIKAGGFSCVQLDLSFKDFDAMSEQVTSGKCKRIRDAFRDANLPIIALSGYTNFMHPDKDKRKANIDYLKTMLRFARELGTEYVASETGTFDADSDWVWHDKNGSEAAYQETCEVIYDIVKFAKECGSTFIVENYVNNVIGSVEKVQRLFSDINSANMGLICDPTNYFCDSNIDDVDGELNRIFNALSYYMKIAHAKDCMRAVSTEEKHANIEAKEDKTFRGSGAVELPAPGLGDLNYDLYLKRLSQHHPNIPLIIEHLDEGDIPRAKQFVDGKLKLGGY
jgi:sugar phosphate isomerase/epimerase